MSQEEATRLLAEGHSLWSVETAQKICRAFELTLPAALIIRWKNQKDVNPTGEIKGIWLDEPDKPGEGVGSIELSNYVTRKLKVRVRDYFGRGSQARANAAGVAKHLALTI